MKRSLANKLIWMVFGSIIALQLVLFILNFYSHPLSNSISDWGSFGDYMAIAISVISIILVYQTYREQRDTNKLICFENAFWNLRKELVHISDGDLNIITKNIKAHFSIRDSISLNQLICLLAYYWSLHTRQLNMPDSSFEHFRKLCQYVTTTTLIDETKKNLYLALLYEWLIGDELFCFICYLSYYSYYHKDVSILEFQATIDFINDANREFGILMSNSLKSNIQLLRYEYDEDLGYSDGDYIKETYMDTLNRLKIK